MISPACVDGTRAIVRLGASEMVGSALDSVTGSVSASVRAASSAATPAAVRIAGLPRQVQRYKPTEVSRRLA